ncbi:hypothetical protein ACIRBX_20885 [Kitasatospora sp. NPDC096147]|uniref:hypothetical protein n=1 Tax=Kitasatospora sp. NPDC096147 TaxID=3364093 RepID=UPI00380F5C44
MVLQTIAFAAIGLAVAAVALLLFADFYPFSRVLTVGTAVVSALLGGVVSGYALDGRLPGLVLLLSAVSSGLLLSVLARPDRAAGHGRHRHA